MISGILLAAGESSRFGSPKALALLEGKPLILHQVERLSASILDEVVVVLGAQYYQIRPLLLKHKHLKVVYNKDYNFGQTSSFQTGWARADGTAEGILLLPVDYPFVKTDTINRLVRKFSQERPKILIPVFEGCKGHPPIFHRDLKEDFLALDYETGLNTVGHRYPAETVLFPVDDRGVTQTFNTPQEFRNLI